MPLTPLDFKFFFFSWQRCPEYTLPPESVVIGEDLLAYFRKLEETEGIVLSPQQRAWYARKAETQLEDMRREYLSTPEEAFAASIEGAYYAKEMAAAELQGRIGDFPAMDGVAVHTAWDLGIGDSTAIWFWQALPGRARVVGYYENSGEALAHYVDRLWALKRERGWTYGNHFVPHDARVRELGTGRTRLETMLSLGLRPL